MAITFSQFRANLKSYCDKAATRRKPIRIRRRQGADLVLLAVDEYGGLVETVHLLSSPKNAARLFAALAHARK